MRNNVYITSSLISTSEEEREQKRHMTMKCRSEMARIAVRSKCLLCQNYLACKEACVNDCISYVYCDNIHCLKTTLTDAECDNDD